VEGTSSGWVSVFRKHKVQLVLHSVTCGFFFVGKKDGKLWPVQDYRKLNEWTIPNHYPLPLITDLIHDLADKKLFTKFDIHWGYNNIRLKEGDEWKAAFKTSKGLFEPTVMFFGLRNSPATFQTMMDEIFRDEIQEGWVKIYIDNIVIATTDDEVFHSLWVDHILNKLAKHDLFLKSEKCHFYQWEVKYLGMIISNGKIQMDPIKVKGITDWPTPTTVREVCSFLGFCNFYHTFIPHFSNIAQPLNDLTCKNWQWIWLAKEQTAFDQLKQVCTESPVLRAPDWTWHFILETDASGFALGAVIAQNFDDRIHPIAFHSQTLLDAERNYNTHDKKLAAIIFGFKCGRPFFLGVKHAVEVRMDHKNLQYFREPQKVTGRQACWLTFLQDFNYTLTHIPGHQNTIANLLSQRSDLNKGVNTNEPCILLPDTLFSEPQHDFLCKIFLKDDTEYRWLTLWQIHDSPIGGHPGIVNTWELVKRSYEGPRLREFIKQYMKGCAKCQETKTNLPRLKAPLQCFDTHVEDSPFQYVSMDLITDLPKSEGYNSTLTIVNQGCPKAAKFIPCTKTIDGPGVAKEYLHHLVPWFGLPRQIILDRDPRFTSNFSHAICKDTGIQQNLSTAFHPWTDGQTEWMNAWVEQYLRPWTSNWPHDWAQLLPMTEFAHNSWKHDVT
jgi:RNase H-like domain found in reverse transcriptase/Reverse transcriptase (RNA-dependent DNA polymerase)/Integrase zinc binding domain